MNILCFIDNLGSGGAQRQLTTLAVGLKQRGHQVRFLVYHPQDHFLPVLQAADIPCQVIAPCPHWKRLLTIRRILREGWQEVVLAFLEGPCWYAELARIPGQRWGLVAGERLADPRINHGTGRWLRQFHRFADAVVSNSHTNRLMLAAGFPGLTGRLATIYNTVDLHLFHPAPLDLATPDHSSAAPCRIVVAAGYHAKKNMLGVAEALLLIKKTPDAPRIVVDWYGAIQPNSNAYRQVEQFVVDNDLAQCLRLHPPTRTIEREYAGATAVGLFSFYEGLPNVVCEAMACGKPIVLSDVCDAGTLVKDGVNGFLCDPASPQSMALALQRLAAASAQNRHRMGAASRQMAEDLFSENLGLERYERVLAAAAAHEPMPGDCSWPAEVPASAVRTAAQLQRHNTDRKPSS
jgi:glycosyltransferase involved in cell wall biosynthesis